ncbi:type 4b pilus protein PilO2 [Pseudomonas cichorii]|nr:type 4b pilus protein PilO2 [Pseudomonas cichorii]
MAFIINRKKRPADAVSPGNSTVQILTYHGRSFVTGLLWHPLGSLTGYMKEARQFGRMQSLDIVALRHTESVIQAGFVSRNEGAVKGMYSLASALAGQLGSSWLAAWKLSPDEDRYVLVAVTKGAVIPGADLVGTGDEIQRKVAQQLSRSIVFEKVFLPSEFNRGNDGPFDIEQLLRPENLKREYKLRPLAFGLSSQELMKLAAVGILCTGGLAGWQQWQSHKQQLAHEAAMRAEALRQAELAALNERTQTPQAIQALEHPWAKKPTVEGFIQGCNGAIDHLPLAIAGWLFGSAKCDGSLLSATYIRTGNSTTAALSAASSGHFDAPTFSSGGNRADLKLTLELPLAGDDELQPASTAHDSLLSWLQIQSIEPQIKEVPVISPQPAALPGQPAPPPPPPPDYKHFDVQYTSMLPPSSVLRDVPGTGLRLREIKTELQNGQLTWYVTGDLYAK